MELRLWIAQATILLLTLLPEVMHPLHVAPRRREEAEAVVEEAPARWVGDGGN
jgi:hypothetical protein